MGSAVDELAGLALGDARLEARTRQLVAALAQNPAAGFPAAVGTVAEREATYRLLGNRRVQLPALLAPHVRQTAQRIQAHGAPPTVVIDKTSFVFRGEGERSGLSRLGVDRHGFDAMMALAVAGPREPLGLLAITPLTSGRGRSPAATWRQTIDAAHAPIAAAAPVYVMDREADSYRLFAGLRDADRDFVVRVAADRWAQEHPTARQELLPTIAARRPVRVTREVAISRRSGVRNAPDARQRHPPREGRRATLVARACPVILPRPPKLEPTLPPQVALHVVHIIEEAPPADAVPVEWWLFTSRPVTTPAEVADVIDRYRARWTIEEYFKALKSGCAYERRQLESRDTLLNALGLLAPLAWRLLALRGLAEQPTAPASAVLDADELHVLRQLARDRPLGPTPTAADALQALARLGGHCPQNGRPGWHVIWTGFRKVLDRAEGYRLARAELTPPSSPSPPCAPAATPRRRARLTKM